MTVSHTDSGGVGDVVIVGHGAAGLSAAVSFLESYEGDNPRVAVLDRAPFEQRGGSTAWTSSSFRLDDEGHLHASWGEIVKRTAGDELNASYVETFYENAVDTLNWLRLHGVRTVTVRTAQSDRPIPGLHAAGEITGIFYGDMYPSGTSALRSFTVERIAGLEVAPSLRASVPV